jgi:hypothetical protein
VLDRGVAQELQRVAGDGGDTRPRSAGRPGRRRRPRPAEGLTVERLAALAGVALATTSTPSASAGLADVLEAALGGAGGNLEGARHRRATAARRRSRPARGARPRGSCWTPPRSCRRSRRRRFGSRAGSRPRCREPHRGAGAARARSCSHGRGSIRHGQATGVQLPGVQLPGARCGTRARCRRHRRPSRVVEDPAALSPVPDVGVALTAAFDTFGKMIQLSDHQRVRRAGHIKGGPLAQGIDGAVSPFDDTRGKQT